MSDEQAIYLQLTGRMGNHLFQFATGYRLALDHQAELVLFDPLGVATTPAGISRVLADTYRFARPADMVKFGRLLYDVPLRDTLDGLFSRAMAPRMSRGGHRTVVREEDFGALYRFHPAILGLDPPLLLTGFFQNEGYFAPRAEQLLAALQLPPVDGLLPPDLARPLIAVVFRRGDYVDHHWALPLRYYEQALDRMAELVPDGTLVVFADDAAFAELACGWLGSRYPVVAVPDLSTDPVDHLALMELCDHHVLANSSFSWWGAWLAEQRRPGATHHLLFPAGWIEDDDALVPSRWERIAF